MPHSQRGRFEALRTLNFTVGRAFYSWKYHTPGVPLKEPRENYFLKMAPCSQECFQRLCIQIHCSGYSLIFSSIMPVHRSVIHWTCEGPDKLTSGQSEKQMGGPNLTVWSVRDTRAMKAGRRGIPRIRAIRATFGLVPANRPKKGEGIPSGGAALWSRAMTTISFFFNDLMMARIPSSSDEMEKAPP